MNLETATRIDLERTAVKAVVVLGKCLEQIKKRELYKPDFDTFEVYLIVTWEKSIHWYERVLAESRWAQRMHDQYGVTLMNGNAARKLASIDEQLVPFVITKAQQLAGSMNLTGAHISAVVRTLIDLGNTGHCDTGDGTMTAPDAAMTVEYTETLLRQKQHAIDGAKRNGWSKPIEGTILNTTDWRLLDGEGRQIVVRLPDDIRIDEGTEVEIKWRIIEQTKEQEHAATTND